METWGRTGPRQEYLGGGGQIGAVFAHDLGGDNGTDTEMEMEMEIQDVE